MIDLFERFANNGRTKFVPQEIDRPLSGKRRAGSVQPFLGFLLIAEYSVSERHNLSKSGKPSGTGPVDQFADALPDKLGITSTK